MPPKDLDEPAEMDTESSTVPALDENAEAPAAEAAPADSSAATDETEADTLSVVRDVVEAREEEQAEAAPSAEGEEGTEGDAPAGEQDDVDYTDVPFNQHPRFKQLLAKAKANEQDAGRYHNVEAFLDQNNLLAAEAQDVMVIAGLAKTNPVEAWKRVQPWVQTLLMAAGEVLPQDLADRVTKNELSRDVALELSRTRAATAANEATQKFERERGQRQQQTQQGRVLMDTAEQWVGQRQIRDPNFAAKQPRLMERIALLQRTEGVPNTPDGVKAQLKKAYDAVNKEFRPAPVAAVPAKGQPQPARRPAIKPVTGGAQVASSAAQPKPKDTMDVIRQLRQHA